jgi:predicted nucleotidyltransferase
MVSLKKFNEIAGELRRIEAAYDVRVLYACESGSRAWGFASRDSDYDVRFLYVHPRDWYLSIEDHRDVIEETVSKDLDISGWELRKALRLLRKSNPPLLEWLKSPVVYAEDETFIDPFRVLASAYGSPSRCFRHYLHMACGNARDYLCGERVWLKKCLYVLRPMLACLWIEQGRGEVPMLFEPLAGATVEDACVRGAIASLVEQKRNGEELKQGPRDEVLHRFIESELARLQELLLDEENIPGPEALNTFFREFCLWQGNRMLLCR